jgi:hypothetical protein
LPASRYIAERFAHEYGFGHEIGHRSCPLLL